VRQWSWWYYITDRGAAVVHGAPAYLRSQLFLNAAIAASRVATSPPHKQAGHMTAPDQCCSNSESRFCCDARFLTCYT
jgi:hypothetical protein